MRLLWVLLLPTAADPLRIHPRAVDYARSVDITVTAAAALTAGTADADNRDPGAQIVGRVGADIDAHKVFTP